MKQVKYINIFILIILAVIIIISGCEYKKPQEFYPRGSDEAPAITGVEPDSAVGGAINITINGQNFSHTVSFFAVSRTSGTKKSWKRKKVLLPGEVSLI